MDAGRALSPVGEEPVDKADRTYAACLEILHEELVPAMGCTEPIAIAYAAARARDVLGEPPERVLVEASEDIVKNARSVVVPNTGKLKGVAAAAAAGIVAGDADKVLQVIASVSEDARGQIASFLETRDVEVRPLSGGPAFDLIVTVFRGESSASVRVSHYHTNIVAVTKDGRTVYQNQDCDDMSPQHRADRSLLSVSGIVDFAESVDPSEIETVLQRQIDYNMAIAGEGLHGDWGANIGSVLREAFGDDIGVRAKALAAAGSDARMGGCALPVVIVSGSGNQGIAASVPVVEYARELGAEKECLYRALVISNLVTVHQKTGLGSLSAYCGAVSAGVGAGAGITWLHGGQFEEVAHTIVNALAIVSGVICDGAKPSCAAKVAIAVEAGILGFHMYQRGQQFYGGEGIIRKGVENTIMAIGRLGRTGMKETDKEIVRLMLGGCS